MEWRLWNSISAGCISGRSTNNSGVGGHWPGHGKVPEMFKWGNALITWAAGKGGRGNPAPSATPSPLLPPPPFPLLHCLCPEGGAIIPHPPVLRGPLFFRPRGRTWRHPRSTNRKKNYTAPKDNVGGYLQVIVTRFRFERKVPCSRKPAFATWWQFAKLHVYMQLVCHSILGPQSFILCFLWSTYWHSPFNFKMFNTFHQDIFIPSLHMAKLTQSICSHHFTDALYTKSA